MADAAQIDIDQTWKELEAGITEVYEQKALSKERFMTLYTHVYNYCTKAHHLDSDSRVGKLRRSRARKSNASDDSETSALSTSSFVGHDLYVKIRKFLEDYLADLTKLVAGKSREDLLNFYSVTWENYTFSSKVMNGFCAYLNRHWVRRESDEGKKDVSQIYQLALEIWKSTVFAQLNSEVTSTILQMIETEREGGTINTAVLKTIVNSYVALGSDPEETQKVHEAAVNGMTVNPDMEKTAESLGTYRAKLESPFLLGTERFYSDEAMTYLSANSTTEYMKKVEQRIIEEQYRVDRYLHSSTLPRLMSTCENVLIEKQLDLFHSEFPKLLLFQKIDDLRRMYDLVNRLHNLFGRMRELLETHIAEEGCEVIKEQGDALFADPKLYINTILIVHKKYSSLIVEAFRNDSGFNASLDKACRTFINQNYVTEKAHTPQKSPEFLARCADLILRKSSKTLDDEEIEESLNDLMIIFKYLDDKDVFQKYYSKMLANRLVNQSSVSDDAESYMITKLKVACGFEYTSKIQRMYQDIGLCRSMNEEYNNWLKRKREPGNDEGDSFDGIDFHMQVLTSGSWPLTQSPDFSLPAELEPHVSLFTIFYNEIHSGRKLNWLFNRSKGEVDANCFPNKHLFQVSTFEMAILLLYNSQESYKIADFMDSTQLSEELVIQLSQILLKAKILTCPDKEDSLNLNSILTLNWGYKNKRLRVNLNVPLRTEQKIDDERTDREVDENRKIQIQCTIVKIAKARKTIQHSSLIAEVCNQLVNRFKASIPMIKKAIDELIDRGYLKRMEDATNTYAYLA